MDAVVIGAGPNGLTAAAVLARHGWRVTVLEAQSRPGGALWSLELTRPGFLHDVGAAFFPFADWSPAFRHLDLAGTGLRWANAPRESCHPAPDGSCATISRDPDLSASAFGPDGLAWRKLALWMQSMGQRLPDALLAPLPAPGGCLASRCGKHPAPLSSRARDHGVLFLPAVPHGGGEAGHPWAGAPRRSRARRPGRSRPRAGAWTARVGQRVPCPCGRRRSVAEAACPSAQGSRRATAHRPARGSHRRARTAPWLFALRRETRSPCDVRFWPTSVHRRCTVDCSTTRRESAGCGGA